MSERKPSWSSDIPTWDRPTRHQSPVDSFTRVQLEICLGFLIVSTIRRVLFGVLHVERNVLIYARTVVTLACTLFSPDKARSMYRYVNFRTTDISTDSHANFTRSNNLLLVHLSLGIMPVLVENQCWSSNIAPIPLC